MKIMKIQRAVSLFGVVVFMGMGSILAGTVYLSAYEKIAGAPLSKIL